MATHTIVSFPRRSIPRTARQRSAPAYPSVEKSFVLYKRAIEARLQRRCDPTEAAIVTDGYLNDIPHELIAQLLGG